MIFDVIAWISIGFFWLYGALAFFQDVKPIKQTEEVLDAEFDVSNRFNRMKARWLIGRKPWILSKYSEFAFMRLDVGDQAEIIADSIANRKLGEDDE